MDTLTIKQKLYDYIDDADEKKLASMLISMIEDTSERYDWSYDEDLIAELDRRSADLKSGKVKAVPLDDAMEYLLNRLK